MKEKFLRFMQGRYGVDQFSKASAHCRIGSSAPVLFFYRRKEWGSLFYFLGWVLIIYCYFRVFSRNVSKRYAENQKYLAKTYKTQNLYSAAEEQFGTEKGISYL